MAETGNVIGIIGLGVMGRNFALNIADHGFAVAGYDNDSAKATLLHNEAGSRAISSFNSLDMMLHSLRIPRALLLLVPAGRIVDAVIAELIPKVDKEDLIIDGGNSHFEDTNLRQQMLAENGIHFLGMGISGGEKGARLGPCMMPGGDRMIYERVRPIFEKCAARVDGEPCVDYMGPGSAGHYVKMVHNGIEYGVLQLIAETYDLAKRGLGLDDTSLVDLYRKWNNSELESFLLDTTTTIFSQVDAETGRPLIDVILDEAKQKGTGRWTSQDAMEQQVPVPTIDASVSARLISLNKHDRSRTARLLGAPESFRGDHQAFLRSLQNAYYASALLTYGQGMSLLARASRHYDYHLDLETIARIWRGGCIIRARLLDSVRRAFGGDGDLVNLLLDLHIAKEISLRIDDLREVVAVASRLGIPVPAFSAGLSYFDGLRSEWLPANLIQALRDDFGAHTYERVDERGVFHTQWRAT